MLTAALRALQRLAATAMPQSATPSVAEGTPPDRPAEGPASMAG